MVDRQELGVCGCCRRCHNTPSMLRVLRTKESTFGNITELHPTVLRLLSHCIFLLFFTVFLLFHRVIDNIIHRSPETPREQLGSAAATAVVPVRHESWIRRTGVVLDAVRAEFAHPLSRPHVRALLRDGHIVFPWSHFPCRFVSR